MNSSNKNNNSKPKNTFLYSKTNLKKNDQCSLQFYNEIKHPDDKRYNLKAQGLFKQGNNIDLESKKIFPNHIEIKSRSNEVAFKDTLRLIDQAYDNNQAILQGCFIDKINNVVIRTDILEPASYRSWNMIEVKSGTKLKDDYIDDVIIQYHVMKNAGIKVNKVEIWTIDKKNKLEFKKNDLTDLVEKNKSRYLELIKNAIHTNKLWNPPKPYYGSHCENCPFRWKCFKEIDNNPKHVANLPNFQDKWKAINEHNIHTIIDNKFKVLYEEYIKNNSLVYKSLIENKPLIDYKKASKFIKNLKYPLYFLDMEAVSYAIPFIENSLPYENVLIQYSIFKYENKNSTSKIQWILEKKENINWDNIATELLENLEKSGHILIWGADLEKILFRNLQKRVTNEDLRKKLQAIEVRFLDLQSIFEKHIYSPLFMGKTNLKHISKILVNIEYNSLRIQNGESISKEFKNYIESNSDFIKNDLMKYNYQDVFSLIKLFNWLFKKVQEQNPAPK